MHVNIAKEDRDTHCAMVDSFPCERLLLQGGSGWKVRSTRPIREKYEKRHLTNPNSLDDYYLYARSLVGFNTKEALRMYADILKKDPDYPWVYHSEL